MQMKIQLNLHAIYFNKKKQKKAIFFSFYSIKYENKLPIRLNKNKKKQN
jgi:hypothetical protein